MGPTGMVHVPLRTCVGCRERAPQAALLRVGLAGGGLVADPRRRLAGRGSYVHPVTDCVRRASARGGFARAFRAQLAPPVVLENAEGLIHDDWGREEQRS
jgi:predicted RNA-binding protein YlxR (DUF448 family)